MAESEKVPTVNAVGSETQPDPEPKSEKGKKYVVKTPWHDNVLLGNGKFPDVTPRGVEMSAQERDKARDAAKVAHIRLKSEEV